MISKDLKGSESKMLQMPRHDELAPISISVLTPSNGLTPPLVAPFRLVRLGVYF